MLTFNALIDQLQGLTFPDPQTETVELADCPGRVLAADVLAPFDQPMDPISAMDGYALRADDAHAQSLVISQRVPAGCNPQPLQPGTAARIFTGAVLPREADTVVLQEHTTLDEQGRVCLQGMPRAGQWVRQPGDDLRKGAVALSAGRLLTPGCVGLLASMGLAQVPVYRRLRVGVLFTGDELRQAGESLGRGQIYNSNRWMWRALLNQPWVELHDAGQVADRLEATREALRALSFCDVILSSGGVSVGEEDHIKAAVEAEGELQAWKVAMKPGKPVAVGTVRRPDGSMARFVGLPGNPVSSYASFLLLVRPLLLRMAGVGRDDVPDWRTRFQYRAAAFDWRQPDERRVEFLRARLGDDGRVALFPNQNSSALAAIAWADGFVKIEPGTPVAAGSLVPYLPLSALLMP